MLNYNLNNIEIEKIIDFNDDFVFFAEYQLEHTQDKKQLNELWILNNYHWLKNVYKKNKQFTHTLTFNFKRNNLFMHVKDETSNTTVFNRTPSYFDIEYKKNTFKYKLDLILNNLLLHLMLKFDIHGLLIKVNTTSKKYMKKIARFFKKKLKHVQFALLFSYFKWRKIKKKLIWEKKNKIDFKNIKLNSNNLILDTSRKISFLVLRTKYEAFNGCRPTKYRNLKKSRRKRANRRVRATANT